MHHTAGIAVAVVGEVGDIGRAAEAGQRKCGEERQDGEPGAFQGKGGLIVGISKKRKARRIRCSSACA